LEQIVRNLGQQKRQRLGVGPGGGTLVDLEGQRDEIPGNPGRIPPPP
jgi:hypothetical protein